MGPGNLPTLPSPWVSPKWLPYPCPMPHGVAKPSCGTIAATGSQKKIPWVQTQTGGSMGIVPSFGRDFERDGNCLVPMHMQLDPG